VESREIQKEHKPKTGDFQANRVLFKVTVYSGKYGFNKKKVWLPRQDQLQEILFSQKTIKACFYRDIHGLSKDFYLFAFQHPEFKSFEQLWLAFVMSEKYNKIFEGKDWIIK